MLIKKNIWRIETHFNVDKLTKHQRVRKIAFLLSFLFLLVIIYLSYFPSFTLFIILSWFGFIFSFISIFASQMVIRNQNKAKRRIIYLIKENYDGDLLKLARTIEYPYSVLKQIITYLEKNRELTL